MQEARRKETWGAGREGSAAAVWRQPPRRSTARGCGRGSRPAPLRELCLAERGKSCRRGNAGHGYEATTAPTQDDAMKVGSGGRARETASQPPPLCFQASPLLHATCRQSRQASSTTVVWLFIQPVSARAPSAGGCRTGATWPGALKVLQPQAQSAATRAGEGDVPSDRLDQPSHTVKHTRAGPRPAMKCRRCTVCTPLHRRSVQRVILIGIRILIARTSCTATKSAPWWWRPETLPRTRTATVNHGLQATPGSSEDHRRWQGGGMVRLAQPADT